MVPMSMRPEEGWERVAARLAHEMDVRGLSAREMERGSRVSFRTIEKLLAGERVVRSDRLSVLARFLGWRGDAFNLIRAGLEPEPDDTRRAHGGVHPADEVPAPAASAIEADPNLSRTQKDILLGVLAEFLGQEPPRPRSARREEAG